MALEAAVGDRAPWIEADVAFHDSILAACHNDLAVHLIGTLRGALRASREATVLMMKQTEGHDDMSGYETATRQALELHRTPFEAIMEGDGERAEAGMRAIIHWVMDVLHPHVDEAVALTDGS